MLGHAFSFVSFGEGILIIFQPRAGPTDAKCITHANFFRGNGKELWDPVWSEGSSELILPEGAQG